MAYKLVVDDDIAVLNFHFTRFRPTAAHESKLQNQGINQLAMCTLLYCATCQSVSQSFVSWRERMIPESLLHPWYSSCRRRLCGGHQFQRRFSFQLQEKKKVWSRTDQSRVYPNIVLKQSTRAEPSLTIGIVQRGWITNASDCCSGTAVCTEHFQKRSCANRVDHYHGHKAESEVCLWFCHCVVSARDAEIGAGPERAADVGSYSTLSVQIQ